jgi:hypothetical protein
MRAGDFMLGAGYHIHCRGPLPARGFLLSQRASLVGCFTFKGLG